MHGPGPKIRKLVVVSGSFLLGVLFEHGLHEVADAATPPKCHGKVANIWVAKDEWKGKTVLGRPTARDVIVGASGANYFYNDSSIVGANSPTGPDLICGREGTDVFYGGDSGCPTSFGCAEVFYGGDGGDAFYGGHGPEIIYGGSGNDSVWGYHGPLVVYGGQGNDHVYTGPADGCEENDPCKTIYGGKGFDHVHLCLPLRRVELHSVEEIHLFKDRFDVHREHRFSPCSYEDKRV